MKKMIVLALSATLLFSSCATTADGAYTGGIFGSIIGSAVGGIMGGPWGSDVGTLVGMAGGAAVGAAAGSANEHQAVAEHYDRVQRNKANGVYPGSEPVQGQTFTEGDQSGFDPNNGGDDRIDFGGAPDPTAPATACTVPSATCTAPSAKPAAPNLEVRNVHFTDLSHDGELHRGELGTLAFEIINRGKEPVMNIQPTVVETTGNKRIEISQCIRIERLAPGEGIRYTAAVRAGRVSDGEAVFVPTVYQNGHVLAQAASVAVTLKRSR